MGFKALFELNDTLLSFGKGYALLIDRIFQNNKFSLHPGPALLDLFNGIRGRIFFYSEVIVLLDKVIEPLPKVVTITLEQGYLALVLSGFSFKGI
ncbi:hypothetical protein BMS3Abin09_00532 [bacterium BMS3Abin09]|nr:hypothetical protein BMS3Abin09_00532 [bacterium BMS3Abin09]